MLSWRIHVFISAALIGLAQATAARAEEPAPIRIARLVAQLGSDAYDVRTRATEDLSHVGAAARESLEAALLSNDPEVRLRAKELLRRLTADSLWQGTRVECGAAETTSDFLTRMSEKSGNRLLLGDQFGSFENRTCAGRVAPGEFWPVLDQFCAAHQYRIRPHYDTRQPGLVVVGGVPPKFPIAYAGPVRACVTSARRAYSEELNHDELTSEVSHTFQLSVQLTWEDQLHLVAYRSQPEVVTARTPTGVELATAAPPTGSWNVAGQSTRQLAMTLKLAPPPVAAREIDTLKLRWGLVAVGDFGVLETDQLKSTEPTFQEDVELVVEAVATGPGQRCEVTAVVVRGLALPEPQEILFQENELELLDSHGHPYRKQGQTNSLTDVGARLKATFLGESDDSVPARLRLRYPRIRSQRDVEIVFRHVPLPVARPE